eukprot:2307300-Pyramimonas_sp.AAC.1
MAVRVAVIKEWINMWQRFPEIPQGRHGAAAHPHETGQAGAEEVARRTRASGGSAGRAHGRGMARPKGNYVVSA